MRGRAVNRSPGTPGEPFELRHLASGLPAQHHVGAERRHGEPKRLAEWHSPSARVDDLRRSDVASRCDIRGVESARNPRAPRHREPVAAKFDHTDRHFWSTLNGTATARSFASK